MSKKTIEIKIKADATFEIDAQGFSGGSCLTETNTLFEGLGIDRSEAELKPEATLENRVDQNTELGHG